MSRTAIVLAATCTLLAACAVPVALSAAPLAGAGPGTAPGLVELAQMGPNGAIDPNRDCHTILRCNYTRGGSYRGCISAYTCRVCRFVQDRCTVTGRESVCRRLLCTW